ncbi:MAG: succinate dehydrogenase iron-sulfur subunit [Acidobacteria bacterium]|nr:succinate dehydrogenase iron-sulfur subunit [Acidobacteriota bacterium]
MNAPEVREVTYRIRRFNPDQDAAPRWEDFRIRAEAGLTVLDGLWRIKETLSPTLSWRSSCRMGICGSCGMLINGKARLACNTQIAELASPVVSVAPLPNFKIIRDLVPDLQTMFQTHRELMPFLVRDDVEEQEQPTREYWQSPHELERYLQFSYCIKCGCCMAACPTVATDPVYAGPMPLGQGTRYNIDSRDGGFARRREVLAGSRGPWRCHFAGECSRVCPKGVDPAKAIQIMRRELVLDLLRLRRRGCPNPVAEPAHGARRADIPAAPERTIGPKS